MSEWESDEDKSYRVNGFCQSSSSIDAIKRGQNITDLRGIRFNSTSKIKPFLITSVDDYMKKVTEVVGDFDYKRPVFYRAHANANYLNVPSSLRDEKRIENEDFMVQEFQRRYSDQFSKCTNTLERLVVMQHYGSFSRCLDVTESPLVALAFVCLEEKKFGDGTDAHKNQYGTITAFRAEDGRDDIKGFDSNTVGVLANTAKCKRDFDYGNLEIHYQNDGFVSQLRNFIYFEEIIRHSVIVRTKQDNPRILNQRGAFILVNANEMVNSGRCTLPCSWFMESVLKKRKVKASPLNVVRLQDEYQEKVNEWDFHFKKVEPYSMSNKYEEFKSDPFDLKRLYLKSKNRERIVFFIPPGCKENIKKQLEALGFTYDFLYPEVDTVFHEIVDKVIK